MYDGDEHTFICGNQKYSVSSQTPGLAVNDDGSVDVYFGPNAHPGLEAKWHLEDVELLDAPDRQTESGAHASAVRA